MTAGLRHRNARRTGRAARPPRGLRWPAPISGSLRAIRLVVAACFITGIAAAEEGSFVKGTWWEQWSLEQIRAMDEWQVILPPKKWMREPYVGGKEPFVRFVPHSELPALCRSGVSADEILDGCAIVDPEARCEILVRNDVHGQRRGNLLLHEFAHCRGWPADHPIDPVNDILSTASAAQTQDAAEPPRTAFAICPNGAIWQYEDGEQITVWRQGFRWEDDRYLNMAIEFDMAEDSAKFGGFIFGTDRTMMALWHAPEDGEGWAWMPPLEDVGGFYTYNEDFLDHPYTISFVGCAN